MSPFDASWLASCIALSAPLLVAALGELVLERSGVLNIGIEGLLGTGAFVGFAVTWSTGSAVIGVVVAMIAAIALSLLMAAGVLSFGGDQIVLGFGIFIFALGATAFLNEVLFSNEARARVPPATPIDIPALSSIPVLGPALFQHTLFVYVAFLAVPVVALLLNRTQLGVMLRAVGESPEAVRATGHSPRRLRLFAFVFAGAMGGLAGTMLSVGGVGIFNAGMSGGRGFVALAAVAFAGWRPWPLLGACLFFGGVDALQLRLQPLGYVPGTVWGVFAFLLILLVVARGWAHLRRRKLGLTQSWLRLPWAAGLVALIALFLWITKPEVSIPAQFYLMLPYVAAIAVLAGLAGGRPAPAAFVEPLPADT